MSATLETGVSLCAYVLRIGDPSGNTQRTYFPPPALIELNLSKVIYLHFLSPSNP